MRTALYDEKTDRVLSSTHPFHECDFLPRESVFRCPPQLDVSVIVPCYNAERFLPGCIGSLAAQQTGYRFEVILVNDGSRDGTPALLEAAAEANPAFRCFHQANQGAAAARNEGLRNARGEYLLFVDADDVVSPNYVQALMDCVQAEDAELGVCAYYSFAGDDRRYKSVQWGRTIGAGDLNGTPWGKLFHRRLFEHLLWPSGYWYEDTVLAFLVYPRVRRIAGTNLCTYGYRSSLQNATHTGRNAPKALDSLYITELVLRGVDALGLGGWLDSPRGQERLIDQFYLNQCHIQKLPGECRREVFRLQSAYMRRLPVPSERLRCNSALYASALRRDNVARGDLAVRLEKANKALRLVARRLSWPARR